MELVYQQIRYQQRILFTYSGLSWQKDASWGTYNITTLTAYNGAKNLKNALIHSDNIYFAQAALKIGSKNMTSGLDKLKFNEDIDFDLNLATSQYSNNGKIEKRNSTCRYWIWARSNFSKSCTYSLNLLSILQRRKYDKAIFRI